MYISVADMVSNMFSYVCMCISNIQTFLARNIHTFLYCMCVSNISCSKYLLTLNSLSFTTKKKKEIQKQKQKTKKFEKGNKVVKKDKNI
jgi:hypothetical protein